MARGQAKVEQFFYPNRRKPSKRSSKFKSAGNKT
jgi:hypothetical protein